MGECDRKPLLVVDKNFTKR